MDMGINNSIFSTPIYNTMYKIVEADEVAINDRLRTNYHLKCHPFTTLVSYQTCALLMLRILS
jgi:hypothetical protein